MEQAVAWLNGNLSPQAESAPAIITLETWAGVWHARYVAPIRTPNTAHWNLYALQRLEPLYGLPVTAIRASALQAIVGALSAQVAPATVQAIVGVWRRCFEAAIDDELLTRNPARRLVVSTAPKRPAARHLTAKEAAMLRTAIVGHRFEAAYALMLGCGLRIGEILGLHWRDVDLAHGRAWIGPQYTNGHWRPLPKASNPHWIPLPAFVIAALIRHRDRQPEGAELVMQSPFQAHGRKRAPSEHLRPWSPQAITRDLAALATSLGIDALTSHAGRHGLATHLMAAGVPPPVIAERLGNTPGVVLSTYGHPTEEGQRQASELVDEYLAGGNLGGSGTESVS